MECLKPMFFHEPIEVSTMLPNTSHKPQDLNHLGYNCTQSFRMLINCCFQNQTDCGFIFQDVEKQPSCKRKRNPLFFVNPPPPCFFDPPPCFSTPPLVFSKRKWQPNGNEKWGHDAMTFPPRSHSYRLSGRCHVAGDVTFLRPPFFGERFLAAGVFAGFCGRRKWGNAPGIQQVLRS